MQKESLRRLGGEGPLDLYRARSRTSGPVCVLISHPHDTALRGRLPSENQFEHGPRTPRMLFDNAAAPVNGGSLAFGFSRPRYAAFRIKPGFTRVLCYIGAAVSPSRLSMLRYENAYPIDSLEHRPVVVDVEVDNKKKRKMIPGKKRGSGTA